MFGLTALPSQAAVAIGGQPTSYQLQIAMSGAGGPAEGGVLFSRHGGAGLVDVGGGRLVWVVGVHMLPGPAEGAALEARSAPPPRTQTQLRA